LRPSCGEHGRSLVRSKVENDLYVEQETYVALSNANQHLPLGRLPGNRAHPPLFLVLFQATRQADLKSPPAP
jgi:hypothetical protein